MLTDRHFPYSSMQEINLDWILTKVKNILRFVPDDGAVGQILRRTAHGAEWSDEQSGGAVSSVNGQTGAVVLDAGDVGALPDTTVIPTDTSDLTNGAGFVTAAGAAAAAPVQRVNGQTGVVSLTIPNRTSELINNSGFVNSAQAAAAAPVQSVNGQTGAVVIPAGAVTSVNGQTGAVVLGKSDVGLGNVDNVQQYSASNPPPYPVTSVNGQTGAVTVSASLTIYHKLLKGTTSASGNLNTGLNKADYIIIAANVNRGESGYYSSFYNILPSGANSSGDLSITAVIPGSSGSPVLASTAIAVDLYYIANTSIEE